MGLLDRTIGLALPLVPRPIVRFFSKPYIGGASEDDALDVVRQLAAEGACTTLDILGEFTTSPEEARENTDAYVSLVRRIRAERLRDANISVKLTALGLLIDAQQCLEHMRQVIREVEQADSFLRIDMEDSPCTDATLDIYRALRAEFGDRRVGIVLQARLHRSLADTDALTRPGANFRLCKGIYLEPASIAHTQDTEIRDNFVKILDAMLESGAIVGIATHDEWLVERALERIEHHGLRNDQYEFQMLLGVLAPLRRRLIAAGHRLRVYVPYGKNWYAYSVRRLRENPQIAGHVLRALIRRR